MKLKDLAKKESFGTAIGVLIFGWLWVESSLLSGEPVESAVVHPLGQPLTFEVPAMGENYGITIDRPKRRGRPGGVGSHGSRRLKWRIEDPNGASRSADREESVAHEP